MEAVRMIFGALILLGFIAYRWMRVVEDKKMRAAIDEAEDEQDDIRGKVIMTQAKGEQKTKAQVEEKSEPKAHAMENQETNQDNMSGESMKVEDYFAWREDPDTSGLMFSILRKLGCQPEKHDDGAITVSVQGENFIMQFNRMYARIWDPGWEVFKADDPELPVIREAVNAANFNFGPTLVLGDPDSNGMVALHSRMDIMLNPMVPDNDYYLQSVLSFFFDTKEHMREEYQKLKAQKTGMQSRNPENLNVRNYENLN